VLNKEKELLGAAFFELCSVSLEVNKEEEVEFDSASADIVAGFENND